MSKCALQIIFFCLKLVCNSIFVHILYFLFLLFRICFFGYFIVFFFDGRSMHSGFCKVGLCFNSSFFFGARRWVHLTIFWSFWTVLFVLLLCLARHLFPLRVVSIHFKQCRAERGRWKASGDAGWGAVGDLLRRSPTFAGAAS